MEDDWTEVKNKKKKPQKRPQEDHQMGGMKGKKGMLIPGAV